MINPTPSSSTAPNATRDSLRAWLRRLAALLLWGALLHTTLEFPGISRLPTLWLIAILFVSFLCALYGFSRIWSAVPYLVTFPIWLPFYLLARLLGLLKFPWRALRQVSRRLSRIYRSPLTAVVHVLVVLVLGLSIPFLPSPEQLRIALLLLLLATINMVVLTLFMSPSLLLSQQVVNLIGRVGTRDRLIGTVVNRRLRNWPDHEELKEAHSRLDMVVRGKDWVKGFVERLLSPRAVVISFLGQLLVTFAVVTLSFGLIYYAAARIESDFFGCSDGALGVGDAVFFSLAVITTSEGSGLCPGLPSSKLLIATELLCGILLLSVAGLGFSTLYVSDVGGTREDLAKAIAQCEREIDYLNSVLVRAKKAAAQGKIPDDGAVARAANASGKTLSWAWAEMIMKDTK